MNNTNKIGPLKALAIISTSVITITGIAYTIYKYLTAKTPHEETKVHETLKADANYEKPIRPERTKKDSFINLLQEIIIEVLSYINHFEEPEALPSDIQQIVEFARKKVCSRRGVTEEDYNLNMRTFVDAKDAEVSVQAMQLEEMAQKIMEGAEPVVNLACDPSFTKLLTLNVFRWISLVDTYIDYETILHNLGGALDKVTGEKLREVMTLNMPKKLERRALILEQKIKKKSYGYDDYFNVVKKPYCKYRLEDKEFDNMARELQRLCDRLQEIACEKLVIPEFQADPCDLELEDVPNFYKLMNEKYSKVDKYTLEPMPRLEEEKEAPSLSKAAEEEKVVVSTNRDKDEIVDSEQKIELERPIEEHKDEMLEIIAKPEEIEEKVFEEPVLPVEQKQIEEQASEKGVEEVKEVEKVEDVEEVEEVPKDKVEPEAEENPEVNLEEKQVKEEIDEEPEEIAKPIEEEVNDKNVEDKNAEDIEVKAAEPIINEEAKEPEEPQKLAQEELLNVEKNLMESIVEEQPKVAPIDEPIKEAKKEQEESGAHEDPEEIKDDVKVDPEDSPKPSIEATNEQEQPAQDNDESPTQQPKDAKAGKRNRKKNRK